MKLDKRAAEASAAAEEVLANCSLLLLPHVHVDLEYEVGKGVKYFSFFPKIRVAWGTMLCTRAMCKALASLTCMCFLPLALGSGGFANFYLIHSFHPNRHPEQFTYLMHRPHFGRSILSLQNSADSTCAMREVVSQDVHVDSNS